MDGSKEVKYPSKIGILTADEIVFARAIGSRYSSGFSNTYYLKTNATGTDYWTMSSFDLASDGAFVEVITVAPKGALSRYPYTDHDELSVRPSVVLRSNVTLDTNIAGQGGTQEHPYAIS